VAAPKTLASSSISPQFSGPFNPRPPDTTISASANDTLSVARTISLMIVFKLFSIPGLNSTISGWTSCVFNSYEFGVSDITLLAAFNSVNAKALLENVTLFTVRLSPLTSGSATAPGANAASSLAAILGAKPLPLNEFESIVTFAFSAFAADAITAAYEWLTKDFKLSARTFNILEAPY